MASVVKAVPEHLTLLIALCRKNTSPLADELLGEVLSEVDGRDEKRIEFGFEAVDAGRANDINQPAYRMLKRLFTLKVPAESNQYEISPKACNSLRLQLYRRAKTGGEAATAARRLLASVERERREGGRPADEPRHPEMTDGLPWTDVLCLHDAPETRFSPYPLANSGR